MKINKSYLLIAAVLTILFSLTPTHSLAQDNIVDRLNKTLGVVLPSDYEAKTKEFTTTNVAMKDEGVSKFTEQFIVEQMKENWYIDRQNQLLFVWAAIYKQITNKNLYNGSDGNKERLDEFKLAMDRWKQCGEKYGNNFDSYIHQRSADADRRSADADRRSADADRQIAETNQEADKALKEVWGMIVDNFHKFKTNPSDLMLKNLKSFKPDLEKLIRLSKRFDFDYKAFLREKIGDDTKYKEFLKIFEIE